MIKAIVHTPFVIPVVVADVQEHLPYLRALFTLAHAKEEFCTFMPGFQTTLDNYNTLQPPYDFAGRPQLYEDIKELVSSSGKLLGYAHSGYTPVVRRLWLNEMQSGSESRTHSHIGNHFSACIYVDVPKGADSIVFNSPKQRFDYETIEISEYTPYNSTQWTFNPREGELYLWESWMQHSVPRLEFAGTRRTVALDIVMIKK